MMPAVLSLAFCLLPFLSFSQYNWTLEKNKDGIELYTSPSPHSKYKAVRVECTFQGTYDKLVSILSKVEDFEDWIYKNKRSNLIKKNNSYDFIYYSETSMPFPLDNRDVILHMTIKTDSLPKFLVINGRNVEGVLPEVPFMVRVPHYTASWKVTMPSANQIHISYILDLNPGGSIPSSIANMFIDKGPYETFRNLEEELKRK